MEKLRRVLSGQDDEEQGLTAQVPFPAAGTAGGRAGREPSGGRHRAPGAVGPCSEC